MHVLLIIPTYNEEKIITENTKQVVNFIRAHNLGLTWKILIADNGSKDRTVQLAESLKQTYPEVTYFHTDIPGRGHALIQAITEHTADIYAYMDADLAVDLNYLPKLITPLAKQTADIAIGSRYMPDSVVSRSLTRAVISKTYNLLLRATLRVNFRDAQCGFKAYNLAVKEQILPQVKDQKWFFDTELLVLAQRKNFRIAEIGVKWAEPKNRVSKVNILTTIWEYLREIYLFKKNHDLAA